MTMDDADLRQRCDHAEHKVRALSQEIDLLRAQAYGLIWHIPGDTKITEIRDTKDRMYKMIQENNAHREFRKADAEKIRDMGEAIEKLIGGTDNGQLNLEINKLRDEIRSWVSWAGQAKAFRRDAIDTIRMMWATLNYAKMPPPPMFNIFKQRFQDGNYDIVTHPGEPHQTDAAIRALWETPDAIPSRPAGSEVRSEPEAGADSTGPAVPRRSASAGLPNAEPSERRSSGAEQVS